MSVDSINWMFAIAMGLVSAYLVVAVISALAKGSAELPPQQAMQLDPVLMELGLTPDQFFLLRIVAGVLFFGFGMLLADLIAGLIFGVIGFFVPAFMIGNMRRKRVLKIELQLIDALDLLGNSLKSGLTLPQATELLVREFSPPISQEFALVLAEARIGVDFTEALEHMAVRLQSNVIFILATGVSIVKRCGGDLSVIFNNIAQTIRDRSTIEGKLEAVTAQGRFQGLILGLMPFALIVVLYFVDRQHVITLFTYQIGIWAFSAVCIMVILAQLWIRKLLSIDV